MNSCFLKNDSGVAVLDQALGVRKDFVGNNVQDDESISGLMTLAEASKAIPRLRGKRVHTSTIFRWCKRGVRGVYLKYGKIGRTIVTTEAWLQQFFCALAEADSAPQDNQNTPRRRKHRPRPAQRQAVHDEAEAILRKAKILV